MKLMARGTVVRAFAGNEIEASLKDYDILV